MTKIYFVEIIIQIYSRAFFKIVFEMVIHY